MCKTFKIIFTSFIVTFLIFLGVGYATVSKDFNVKHEINGVTQEEVFITDFSPTSGEINEGTVKDSSFIKSILTSDISLNNAGSSITYTVTVHNNAEKPYCYIGTRYDKNLGYSNTDIGFELSIKEGEWDSTALNTSVVDGNGDLTFTIKFTNEGNESDVSLESVLEFLFIPLSDTQKVTLYYEDDTYIDAFPKTENVATFPNLNFDVVPTTTTNNVARCNLNATPYYDETLKQIHVTGVDSAGNNVNNEVKCEIYDSLGLALGDEYFEKSNYTINNILVMNDVDATDYNVHVESTVPENLMFNVDMNNKNVYIDCVGYAIRLTNASVVNINNCKLLSCGGKVHSIFEIDNEDAELYINGGEYKHASTGNAIYPKQGKLIIRNADIKSPNGNIFRVGTTVAKEASDSNYNVHVEVIGGSAKSTNANIVHSISRGTVLFSFVDVDLSSGQNIILCNNDKLDDNDAPEKGVYDNVRFYITGGSINCGNGREFSTYGSYLFYTNNISYASSNTEKDIRGITGGSLNISEFHYYAVKNYYQGETNGTIDEKWYMVKDINGDYVYSSNGRPIKVGDRITFNSVKNTNYNMGAVDSSYGKGSKLQTATAASNRTQRWMFLASSDPGYYNIVPYYKPIMMIFIHVAAANVQSTGGNLTNLQGLSNQQSLPGGRFRVKCAIGTDGKPIKGAFSILNKVDAGYPKGTTLGKYFALDISNSTTMNEGLIIQGYKDNDTAAQQWKLIKNNK